MKKLSVIILLFVVILGSCSDKDNEPKNKYEVKINNTTYALPMLQSNDIKEIVEDLKLIAIEVKTEKNGYDYIISAKLDTEKEKVLFSSVKLTYKNMGIDGFTFQYEYDETKNITYEVKKELISVLNSESSLHKLEQITNY